MLLDEDLSYSTEEICVMMLVLDNTLSQNPVIPVTAIELGAGVGRITTTLASRVKFLTAVELVPSFATKNKERCIATGINNVLVICADVREFEVPSTLDMAFIKWILMFLSDEEAENLLNKIANSLVVGGIIFLNETCVPKETNSFLYCCSDNYIANYRSIEWYSSRLNAIGGTLTISYVLDDVIYKDYIERSGDKNQQPILIWRK